MKPSDSSIKHVELETLEYVCSGYGRYLPDFILYFAHEPCDMCAGACVWSRIGAVVYGASQEDIAASGSKHGTDVYKWRACLIRYRVVFEKGNHIIPVTGGFLRKECHKLFSYRSGSEQVRKKKKPAKQRGLRKMFSRLRLFKFDVVAGVYLVSRNRDQHRGGIGAAVQHDALSDNFARQIVPGVMLGIAAKSV